MRHAKHMTVVLALMAAGCGYLDDELLLDDDEFAESITLEGFGSGYGFGSSSGCGGLGLYGRSAAGHGNARAGEEDSEIDDAEYDFDAETIFAERPEEPKGTVVRSAKKPGTAEAVYYETLAARQEAAVVYASRLVETTGEPKVRER